MSTIPAEFSTDADYISCLKFALKAVFLTLRGVKVSFMLRLLYLLDKRLNGPQSRSGRCVHKDRYNDTNE